MSYATRRKNDHRFLQLLHSRRALIRGAGGLTLGAAVAGDSSLPAPVSSSQNQEDIEAAIARYFSPALNGPHIHADFTRSYFRRGWRRNGNGVIYRDFQQLVDAGSIAPDEAEVFGNPQTLYVSSIIQPAESTLSASFMRRAPLGAAASGTTGVRPWLLTRPAAQAGLLQWLDSRYVKHFFYSTVEAAAEVLSRAIANGLPDGAQQVESASTDLGPSVAFQRSTIIDDVSYFNIYFLFAAGNNVLQFESLKQPELATPGDSESVKQEAVDLLAKVQQFSTPGGAAQSSLFSGMTPDEIAAIGRNAIPAGHASPSGNVQSSTVAQWDKFRTVAYLLFGATPEEDADQQELNEAAQCKFGEEGMIPDSDVFYQCQSRFYTDEEWSLLFQGMDLPVQERLNAQSGTEVLDDSTFNSGASGQYLRVTPTESGGASFAGYRVCWLDELGPVQYIFLITTPDSGGESIDPDAEPYRRLRDGAEVFNEQRGENSDNSSLDPGQPRPTPVDFLIL